MRGGRAGYGAGSSFLMDFNTFSRPKLQPRLFQIMTQVLYSVINGATRTLVCAHDRVQPPLVSVHGLNLCSASTQATLKQLSKITNFSSTVSSQYLSIDDEKPHFAGGGATLDQIHQHCCEQVVHPLPFTKLIMVTCSAGIKTVHHYNTKTALETPSPTNCNVQIIVLGKGHSFFETSTLQQL